MSKMKFNLEKLQILDNKLDGEKSILQKNH